MSNRAGTGFSENTNSFEAGVEGAKAAVVDAGVSEFDLVLLFSTARHQPARLRDGVRSVVGPKPRLIGGYGSGIIATHQLGYDGYQAGWPCFHWTA